MKCSVGSGKINDQLRVWREVPFLSSSFSPSLPSPQKADHPLSAWPPQVADHLVPNQVLGFFEFQGKREGGSFLFSKICKSSYRRRFKGELKMRRLSPSRLATFATCNPADHK
jgi:hypothetical protein